MTRARIVRDLRTPAQQQIIDASRAINDKAELFGIAWRSVVGVIPEDSAWRREHEFAKQEGRKWRFDWAHIPTRVAVEVDGGNRMARIINGRAVAVGRHTQDDDYEKMNAATAMGWRVFRFSTAMIVRDPDGCAKIVARAMGVRN
ncbi:hypothetical protein [Casimicrobium huifangae]|uniref:hypothetical protein n=1 Tax=Casimicrobium huifangae TaxID=2591109 RepID=UPI003783E5E3